MRSCRQTLWLWQKPLIFPLEKPIPVSYTPLDVYKRQAIDLTVIGGHLVQHAAIRRLNVLIPVSYTHLEMLQDLIMAAVNEALRKGEETREATMGKLNPGMGGMF